MSEHTDATDDRPEDAEGEREDTGPDEPQPWAKALPGDEPDGDLDD